MTLEEEFNDPRFGPPRRPMNNQPDQQEIEYLHTALLEARKGEADLRAQLAAAQVCEWTLVGNCGWLPKTACGGRFTFDEEPSYTYCPDCGRRVKIVGQQQQTNKP